MARIRTVKPEFWEDETIGSISRDARLLFIATWNLADDTGVLRWSAPYLKASVFMYDDDLDTLNVSDLMEELAKNELVRCFTVEKTGQSLAQVANFTRHQVINRPQPTKFPRPPWEAGPSVNDSLNDSLMIPGLLTVGREGKGKERKGEGKETRATRSTPFPQGFKLEAQDVTELQNKHSLDINWLLEFEKFRNYHQAKGSKFVDWKAAWRNWTAKAVEYAKPATPTEKKQAEGRATWF
jgi:hypothetical protein